jgi:protoporphyrinogen IX oxidase
MQPLTLLLATHVLALLLWIGSLVSITRVITAGVGEEPAVQAKLAALARRIYRTVASPWMGIATLAGVGMIAVAKGAYFHYGWFHGKLTLGLVMLALHFVLGARVRAAEAAGRTDGVAPQMRALQLGVLVTAALAVFSVIVLKALRGA